MREIYNDSFAKLLYTTVVFNPIHNILEIGSGTGEGSTSAFVKAIIDSDRTNKAKLYCLELYKANAAMVKVHNPYTFVHVLQGSSIPFAMQLTEDDIREFYSTTNTNLNSYSLETILGWKSAVDSYIMDTGIAMDGTIQQAKQEIGSNFDMVLIDGGFSGHAELQQVLGTPYIALDDINDIKNYRSYFQLKEDPSYKLVEDNWTLRNGYALFKRTT